MATASRPDFILPPLRDSLLASWKGRPVRALRLSEVEELKRAGCTAEAWEAIWVARDFELVVGTLRLVGCRFEGHVELGCFTAPGAGLYHSTVRDSSIGDDTRVFRCDWVDRCFVGAGARLESIGRIGLRGERSRFGNGLELFREDLFSRRVRVFAESKFDDVARLGGPEMSAYVRANPNGEVAGLVVAVAGDPGMSLDPMESGVMRRFVASERSDATAESEAMLPLILPPAYTRLLDSDRAFVAPGVSVRATGIVENCFLGPNVEIDGVVSLRDCTIFGTKDEPTRVLDGVVARDALIGPGCTVECQATLERSILFEHVHVGAQAIVKGSAVGANARLAGGEINDSLVGPFTMSIHHGALIAAWWPEGKGNVAYGANVGSNHTGRAPDQEIWPGEGNFFGLGCDVKFPCNLREAPYTIIASGAVLLPQKIAFPFSLLTTPTRAFSGVSPGLNELRPGWGLLHNAYGIERHEIGFRAKNRARRTGASAGVFRPEIVNAFLAARRRLEVAPEDVREVYDESAIPGLGKNVMTEEARLEGLEAYKYGRLAGASRVLLDALRNGGEPSHVAWAIRTILEEIVPDAVPRDDIPLDQEPPLPNSAECKRALEAAIAARRTWLERAREAKRRDDARGRAVFDDYDVRHVSADDDPMIRAMERELADAKQNLFVMMSKLGVKTVAQAPVRPTAR